MLRTLPEMRFITSRISFTTPSRDCRLCTGSESVNASCGKSLIASKISCTASAEERWADWVKGGTENKTRAVANPTLHTVYHHALHHHTLTPDPPRLRLTSSRVCIFTKACVGFSRSISLATYKTANIIKMETVQKERKVATNRCCS